MTAEPSQDTFAAYERSSPTLLAQQPPTVPEKPWEPDFDWDVTFSALESRMNQLRNVRYSYWYFWAKLAEYLLPRRWRWLCTANDWARRGNNLNTSIIDSTATLAMNICASGMVDGIFPSNRPWFKLGLAIPGVEPDADAKDWLEDTENRIYTILAQSNFYTSMAQAMQDLTVFGTSPVLIYEDSEDVIRCYVPCAGEYMLAVSSRFSVDTFYREFTLTVAQIVDMFTVDACPRQVQELWEQGGGSLENEFVVAHCVEPNFALNGRGSTSGKKIEVVKGKFPFREVYWLRGMKSDQPLSKRGFNGKPFVAFRWSIVANDAYGRSPGMDAFGDTAQLQLETRAKGEAIQKIIRPPMGADPELKNEPASINPAQITYVSSQGAKKGFWPLFELPPGALKPLTDDLKEIQQRIKEIFLVDVWMAISQMEGVQPRQNLEIAERRGEKMQRLGPVVGLVKTEGAEPALVRVMDIASRRKILRPMPDSLRGIPLKVTFLDMVTLAQLGSQTAAMEQTFAVAGKLSEASLAAQGAFPNPARIINWDDSMRDYAGKANFPMKDIYSPKEVEAHDQAKAQAANANMVGQAAIPAVTAAKTLSETQVGGGQSALQAMLGTRGGPVGAGTA